MLCVSDALDVCVSMRVIVMAPVIDLRTFDAGTVEAGTERE